MYSAIIKRAFDRIYSSSTYIDMDNNIRILINTLKHIERGLYYKGIIAQSNFNYKTWISEHKADTFMGAGHGVLLPIDKQKRLDVLLGLFKHISENSFEEFINECYSDDYLYQGMDFILLITGVCEGLKGKSELNLQNMKRHKEREIKKIERFNEELSHMFEDALLSDIEEKYSKNNNMTIMGDYFGTVSNSTIVNKSIWIDVVENEKDPKIRNSLIELKKIVEESKDEEAIGFYNDFLEELALKQPQKRKLKSFWNSLVNSLPKIKDLTDITVGITSLFN